MSLVAYGLDGAAFDVAKLWQLDDHIFILAKAAAGKGTQAQKKYEHLSYRLHRRAQDYYFNIKKIIKRVFLSLFVDLYGYGSVWISDEYRPEYWTKNWRNIYAVGEPDFSGNCLYLSASR